MTDREAAQSASRELASISGWTRDEVSVTFACGVTRANTPGRRQSCVATSCDESPTTPAVLHSRRAATEATLCARAIVGVSNAKSMKARAPGFTVGIIRPERSLTTRLPSGPDAG